MNDTLDANLYNGVSMVPKFPEKNAVGALIKCHNIDHSH